MIGGIELFFFIFELPQGQAGHSIKKKSSIPYVYIVIGKIVKKVPGRDICRFF